MMDYPQVSIDNAGAELNRLHSEIEGKLRSTVADAIRAGEILSQVKDRLKHGDFLPWIKANCNFSQDTAERYRKIFSNSDKIRTVRNLQEAYAQIESLEAAERRKEAARKETLIKERIKTGEKPEGWDRSLDYEFKKRTDEEAFQARKEAAFAEKRAAREAEEAKVQTEARAQAEQEFAPILSALGVMAEATKKRAAFKERIRVSHEGKDDPFVDAIMDYLETLGDDNRRIEACSNIIKVCRGIANELQAHAFRDESTATSGAAS